jgi:hypothetical protein
MSLLDTLIVELVGKTDQFQESMKEASEAAEESSNKIGTSLDGVSGHVDTLSIAVGELAAKMTEKLLESFKEFYMEALEAGENINKVSERLGVATDELQKFQYAASLTGSSAENMNSALQFMDRNLSKAGDGNKVVVETLSKLGLSMDKLVTMRPADQFLAIADAISKVKDPADRMRSSLEIFGRGAGDLVPLMKLGADGIRELGTQAENLGAILGGEDLNALEEAKDAFEKLEIVSKAAASRMIASVAPAMQTVVEQSINVTATLKDAGASAIEFYTHLFNAMTGGEDLVEGFTAAASTKFADFMRGLASIVEKSFGVVVELVIAFIEYTLLTVEQLVTKALLVITRVISDIGSLISHVSATAGEAVKSFADKAATDLNKFQQTIRDGMKQTDNELVASFKAVGDAWEKTFSNPQAAKPTPPNNKEDISEEEKARRRGVLLVEEQAKWKAATQEKIKDSDAEYEKAIKSYEGITGVMNKFYSEMHAAEDKNTTARRKAYDEAVKYSMDEREVIIADYRKRESAILDMDVKSDADKQKRNEAIIKLQEKQSEKLAEIDQRAEDRKRQKQEKVLGYTRKGGNEGDQTEVEMEEYQKAQRALNDLKDSELPKDKTRAQMKEDIEKRHQQAMSDIKTRAVNNDLTAASQFFGNMSSLMQSGNKNLFEIGKAAAYAQTVVNTAQAAMASFKFGAEIGGPVLGGVMAAAAITAGMVQLATISGAQMGGGGSVSSGGAGSIGGVANPPTTVQNVANTNMEQTAPTSVVNISIQGDNVSRQQIVDLIDQINDAQRDGNVILQVA